jgi:hypothetical protein
MLCEQARRIKKVKAAGRAEGTGMSARQMADGRWVKTMVLTLPMRLAMEDATSMDAAEIRLVVKKIEPSSPSGRENLRLKKYVIQDL